MGRSSNIFKRLDWWTVLIYALLIVFGWINIYAAVYNEDHNSIFDITQKYGKQILWMSVAIIIIILLFIIDSSAYEILAYPLYAFSIFLLLTVLIFGKELNGARSWFEIGSIRFQPAEFTKVATALALAKFMGTYNFKIGTFSNMFKVAGIILLPMLMIILQNDTGSALIFISFIIVLYREGLSPIFLLVGLLFSGLFLSVLLTAPVYVFIALFAILLLCIFFIYFDKQVNILSVIYVICVGIVIIINNNSFNFKAEHIIAIAIVLYLIALLYPAYFKKMKGFRFIFIIFILAVGFTFSVEYIFNNILEKHQRTRINVVLGVESDPQGVGYNVNQSKIAIGSGGFMGKGFLQGTQTKYDFVPEQDTDFIFCTVGEEWGFIGTFSVVLLFGGLLIRIIVIAERQRIKMYRIYGYSVASILFFHVAINVGMTIGLAPVIGIPLPFFSYGGSSFWSFTILLFILLRLDATRMDRL